MGIDFGTYRRPSRVFVLITTVSYLAGYVLLRYSGLFSLPPENIFRALHAWPALLGAGMLVLVGAAGLAALRSRAGEDPIRLSGNLAAGAGWLGLLLIGAGIVTSSFTRFEGSVTLHESQEAALAATVYDAGTLYRRRFSREPNGGILMEAVAPFPQAGGPVVRGFSAEARLRKDPASPPRALKIGSLFPAMADGFLFRIAEAGYSPHLFLFDLSGNSLLDIYAIMRLYPPGAEDSFRFDKIIPHTFYLRYYPDVSLLSSATGTVGIRSGPAYEVRIVRNLDLLADRYAAPDELIRFDSLFLSVGDSRRWVRITIVRDPGMVLLLAGLVLTILRAISLGIRRTETIRY
ncbi:MAG: hypothetical protein OEW15_01820 [Nitrospirota bacterium]|nr:hypothetical protein [Nitrospirota bacterium]